MRSFTLLVAALVIGTLIVGCDDDQVNKEPLVDPWLRERTPTVFKLEGQIGAHRVANDWRNDDKGEIIVMVAKELIADLSQVEVIDIGFKYKATASITKGGVIDLSSGQGSFVVTAENGDKRTYTVLTEDFVEPLLGTYKMDLIKGVLDQSAAESSVFVYGGSKGGSGDGTLWLTMEEKNWNWESSFRDENDNLYTFTLDAVDSKTGDTEGTVVNDAGADQKYGEYKYKGGLNVDLGNKYRLIPVGTSKWKKNSLTAEVSIYNENAPDVILSKFKFEGAKKLPYIDRQPKEVTVPNNAFLAAYEGDFVDETGIWGDHNIYYYNIRVVVWMVKKVAVD